MSNHFYYLGWRARIRNTNEQFNVRPSDDGLLQIDIPPGQYDLVLELPFDGAERAGLFLSILSSLLVFGSAGWAWRRPRSGSNSISTQLKYKLADVSAAGL